MSVAARVGSSVRRAAAALVCAGVIVSGCSAANGGGSTGQLGDPCRSAGDCLASVCLPFQANFEGVPGVCSSACQTSADCASGGVCLPDPTGTVVDACFRRCASASDCSSGLACVWDADAASGVCAAVAVTVCSGLVGAGDCATCIANNCCSAYEACVADVTCGQAFARCGGGPCTAKLASSSDSAASSLGSCMGSACAGVCP
jgi:hypothetical protein